MKKKKYIHKEITLFNIIRISFFKLGLKKLCLRFEISWGWTENKRKN